MLDTNVLLELRKVRLGKADANVAAWAERVDAADLFVSVITIMELELGVLSIVRKDAPQGAILRSWLEQHVLPEFSGRTLPIDTAVAQRSAACNRQARRARRAHRSDGASARHGSGHSQRGRFQADGSDYRQPVGAVAMNAYGLKIVSDSGTPAVQS
ncbi:VapC toxin family PIN domain ribonuclease [Xanthomonas populi]|uniref:VapC toxin family PIN domain ribonuclease n=1 Tax=Xanthomonas populi TaxID=53414 RepID=UPI001FCA4059|nr:VapC toxin family PIN domain ribonuclease [Xanthomonas populi]